jgi:hypothetical protein
MTTLDIDAGFVDAGDQTLEQDVLTGTAYAAVYRDALQRKKKHTNSMKLHSSYDFDGAAVYEDITTTLRIRRCRSG